MSTPEPIVHQPPLFHGTSFTESPVASLEKRLGAKWPNLAKARELSETTMLRLQPLLSGYDSGDASIVSFGSLARGEFTHGSDLDWTLLIDGIADPEHLDTARAIRSRLESAGVTQPGREGTFGKLAFSHEMVHLIGGQDDTNANTTRRILLLLESRVIGDHKEAHGRVMSSVLKRYFQEDNGLWQGSGPFRVPRFLLNDFARYWRTMAVDFAYKQRSRGNDGFALRNIKLRMSRKLLYISGLLACFSLELLLSDRERDALLRDRFSQPVIAYFRKLLEHTPLELVAIMLQKDGSVEKSAMTLFTAYDKFLALLADDSKLPNGKTRRKHLDDLRVEELASDPIYQEARSISHEFRQGVREIFLTASTKLGQMTIEYGVF